MQLLLYFIIFIIIILFYYFYYSVQLFHHIRVLEALQQTQAVADLLVGFAEPITSGTFHFPRHLEKPVLNNIPNAGV